MRVLRIRPCSVPLCLFVASGLLVGGCARPSGGAAADPEDTRVAGIVLERDDPSTGADPTTAVELAAGPAATGLAWTVVDGDWVGLGARTLAADGTDGSLALDVAVGEAAGDVLDDVGCELTLQAPAETPLLVRGELEAMLVVETQADDVLTFPAAAVTIDVLLAPGELYRAPLPLAGAHDADPVVADAGDDAAVRCAGRFVAP